VWLCLTDLLLSRAFSEHLHGRPDRLDMTAVNSDAKDADTQDWVTEEKKVLEKSIRAGIRRFFKDEWDSDTGPPPWSKFPATTKISLCRMLQQDPLLLSIDQAATRWKYRINGRRNAQAKRAARVVKMAARATKKKEQKEQNNLKLEDKCNWMPRGQALPERALVPQNTNEREEPWEVELSGDGEEPPHEQSANSEDPDEARDRRDARDDDAGGSLSESGGGQDTSSCLTEGGLQVWREGRSFCTLLYCLLLSILRTSIRTPYRICPCLFLLYYVVRCPKSLRGTTTLTV
jgi:hypothetical protein